MSTQGNKIFADFFKVTNTKGCLSDVLEHLISLPVDRRNVDLTGLPHRLETIDRRMESGDTFYEGEFVKVRMDKLPVKASRTAGVSGIGLSEDEGIGEETAFLYSKTHDVLILQRNRLGTTSGRVADYFNHFGKEVSSFIELSVMMNDDALKRLEAAKSLKSLSVSIHKVKDHSTESLRGGPVEGAEDAMNDLGGDRVTLTVSLKPRRDGSLIRDKITRAVTSLLRMREDDVQSVPKIQVKAEDEDGTSVIDFIRERLFCADTIPNDKDRHLSYTARRSFLRAAWNFTGFQKTLRATDLV